MLLRVGDKVGVHLPQDGLDVLSGLGQAGQDGYLFRS